MRITLDIADDVLSAVTERARQERRTVGEVLSDLAREALSDPGLSSSDDAADEVAGCSSFDGFDPLPHRGPAVTNEWIDQLRDSCGQASR